MTTSRPTACDNVTSKPLQTALLMQCTFSLHVSDALWFERRQFLNENNLIGDRSADVVGKDIATSAENLDLNSGLVKSDDVTYGLTPLRRFRVYLGAKSRRWGYATRYTLRRNTASIMKIFEDLLGCKSEKLTRGNFA